MIKNKKLLIAGNWKMNGFKKNLSVISLLIKYIKLKKLKSSEILICPPNTLIDSFSNLAKRSKLSMQFQFALENETGAFVLESTSMLKDSGAQAVILGHSERREHQEESNKLIHAKAKNSLKNDLLTIVCVGESLIQKKNQNTLRVIGEQLKEQHLHIQLTLIIL